MDDVMYGVMLRAKIVKWLKEPPENALVDYAGAEHRVSWRRLK